MIEQVRATPAAQSVTKLPTRLPLSLFSSLPEGARHRPGARSPAVAESTPLWLWVLILSGTFGPLFLLLNETRPVPDGPRAVGAILWVLSWVPTVVYFATPSRRRPPIPVLPMMGVFFALYFPLQLLMGLANVNELVSLDASVDYQRPAQLALIGWTLLLVGYAATVICWPQSAHCRPPRWSVPALKRHAFALQVGGLATDILRPLLPVPPGVNGILVFFSILSLFGSAILLVLAKRGRLTRAERSTFWLVTAVTVVVQIGTGSVATFARTGVILILAAWVAGARLRASIVAAALVFATIVVTFRGFVIEFRVHTWWSGESVSQSRRAALWWSLISGYAERAGVLATVGHGIYVVATRSATLDLYADVVQRTPEVIPHWNGRTYHSLIGALVPRLLWPDKPPKLVGNQFGHRYSYLGAGDRHTSINLPTPIEFYVNFGESGVLFGMAALGVVLAVLGRVLNRAGQDWVRSLAGVILLVPVVTNLESDFSLVFGGLILNGAALFVVYRVLVHRCTAEPVSDWNRAPARGRAVNSGLTQAAIAIPRTRALSATTGACAPNATTWVLTPPTLDVTPDPL